MYLKVPHKCASSWYYVCGIMISCIWQWFSLYICKALRLPLLCFSIIHSMLALTPLCESVRRRFFHGLLVFLYSYCDGEWCIYVSLIRIIIDLDNGLSSVKPSHHLNQWRLIVAGRLQKKSRENQTSQIREENAYLQKVVSYIGYVVSASMISL